MAARAGFTTINSDSYIYIEASTGSSTAIGIDTGTGQFEVIMSATPGAAPGAGFQAVEIDPVTGVIALNPIGGGYVNVTSPLQTAGTITVLSGDVAVSAGNIEMPYTNVGGTEGLWKVGGVSLINTTGGSNVFFGTGSGNTLVTLTGTFNTSVGVTSFQALTSGQSNTGVGAQVLNSLTTGDNNVCIGALAGSTYTGDEDNNILISNVGVVGEDNVIRIGTAGTQTSAFIAGTYNTAVGATAGVALIDSVHQIGSISGTSSQVLLGGTKPSWGQVNLTSQVTGVLPIANGGTNASSMATTFGVNYFDGTRIVTTAVGTATHVLTSNGVGVAPTFQAIPAGGITTLNGDAGSATGATVTIAGTANQISTSAAASTVTLALTSSVTIANDFTQTNGDHFVGNTDSATTAPIIQLKKSRAGTVITSGDILGEIDFQGVSTGSTYVTGASIKCTSSGTIAANRVASNMVFATHSDSASGSTPTDRMTIASTGAVTIAAPDSGVGLTISGGGQTITSGNLTLSSGLVAMPTTSSTVGQVTINSSAFMHAFGTDNAFVGFNCGNFTLSGAAQNTGMGSNALNGLTSGDFNSGFGRYALNTVSSGSLNSACGDEVFPSITTGDRNTGIGYNAGGNHTTSDSHNICIGSNALGVGGTSNRLQIAAGTGTGNGQVNKAFIHGVRGITTANADAIAVLVDSAGQFGTVSSSIRYKENVRDMEGASERIYALQPKIFNYKTYHPSITSYGLIAEEVLDIFPELVAHNAAGEPESVKYHDLPVLLLNEIKKLRARIEVLERK